MSKFLLKVVNQLPGEGKKLDSSNSPEINDLMSPQGSATAQGNSSALGNKNTQGNLTAQGTLQTQSTKTAQGKTSTQGTSSAQSKRTAQGKPTSPRKKSVQINTPSALDVSPQRDYMKAANSIVRLALSTGLFRGKSKQLYDFLYSKTRGSINPNRSAQLSRAEIMRGSHIGSTHTLRDNLQHLHSVGLVKWEEKPGQQEGNVYFVFLPEEIFGDSTGQFTCPDHPEWSGQNLPRPPRAESAQGAQGINVTESIVSENSKTLLKTYDDDDTHTLREFIDIIEEGAREVCGGELNKSEQEKTLWKELAELLVGELKSAASKTETVSSVPAFLSAQLKRQFTKNRQGFNDKPSDQEKILEGERSLGRVIDSHELPARKNESVEAGKSVFAFEDRRRYAQNQQPPLGNGWMVESSTGKYDELIGEWLKTQNGQKSKESGFDVSACPDCHGTGMFYPDGFERGATKCRHERLPKQ